MKRGFVRSAISRVSQLPPPKAAYDPERTARIASLGRHFYPNSQVAQALFNCYALGVSADLLPYVWRLLRTHLYFRQIAPDKTLFGHLYVRSEIPKKNGGVRVIDAPKGDLKKLQQQLLPAFNFALERAHQQAGELGVHGFRSGRSNITAAVAHVGRPCVVKLDVQNFFPSIKKEGVTRSLDWVASRSGVSDLGWLLKSLLVEILTVQGNLPAGAPTSPVLSNLFMLGFDHQIRKVCSRRGVSYTRYADDITLSGESEATRELIGIVRGELSKLGLELNPQKVNIQRKGRRQKVCGVIVNDKPSIGRDMRRKLRAAEHRAKSGQQSHLNGQALTGLQLAGHLAYAQAIRTAAKPFEVHRP